MPERQPISTHQEKGISFAYSTAELSDEFLRESFLRNPSLYDDSLRQTGVNLESILEKRFPGQSEFTQENRTQIVKEISEGKLAFGYMAFMLRQEHPMVKNWPEKDKRKVLNDILQNKISYFETHIAEIKADPIRWVDTSTVDSVKKEMAPYQNFKKRLL